MKILCPSALAVAWFLFAAVLVSAGGGADKVPLHKGEKIVFLGDSITAGGVSPKGYVTLVKNALQEKYKDLDLQVLGAGVSGNKVPDLQKRLDRDVLSKKPGLVVIYIGINDVWHGENDPKRGTSPEAFETGLKEVVERCQGAGAGVLLCTPTVIGELPGGANKLDAQLDKYAELSRKVARGTKVPLCDLRKAFIDHEEKNNTERKEKGVLTGDRVHLNEAGNRLVADTILRHLGQ